jgi:hypothetical protein
MLCAQHSFTNLVIHLVCDIPIFSQQSRSLHRWRHACSKTSVYICILHVLISVCTSSWECVWCCISCYSKLYRHRLSVYYVVHNTAVLSITPRPRLQFEMSCRRGRGVMERTAVIWTTWYTERRCLYGSVHQCVLQP